jgi:hypothetical protein
MKTPRVFGAVVLLASGLLVCHSTWATDKLDVSVAMKTLPLLTTKIPSPSTVAVVYDPVISESKIDAEKIKSYFDAGLETQGNVKLVPELVGTDELGSLSKAKIAIYAHGLTPGDYKSVSAVTANKGVLTICTDLDGVKTNHCILGVASNPQVEVYYSSAAAEAAGISFASAFTMLVKQVGSM